MGKTFKVHMDFDLDEITTEEHCGCGAPNDTVLDQLNQMFQWVQPSRKKSFNNVSNRNNSNLFRAKNNSLETIESWANYKNHSEEWSGELWSGRAEDIHYDRLGLKHCKLWGIASSSYFETFKTDFFHAHIISFSKVHGCPLPLLWICAGHLLSFRHPLLWHLLHLYLHQELQVHTLFPNQGKSSDPLNAMSKSLIRSVASSPTMPWSSPWSSLLLLTTPLTWQRQSSLCPRSWR